MLCLITCVCASVWCLQLLRYVCIYFLVLQLILPVCMCVYVDVHKHNVNIEFFNWSMLLKPVLLHNFFAVVVISLYGPLTLFSCTCDNVKIFQTYVSCYYCTLLVLKGCSWSNFSSRMEFVSEWQKTSSLTIFLYQKLDIFLF
jgi:hypothetical protein